ncbi:YKL069W [Candida theae]|uniref:YKL069W n=1 Tax=Candida theae TaxID=1198502 RepID=A0AAD5BGI9_9ASCO|nr:YKL069W [Candida theae]KAI5960470.1 YKL069W [Candida theae]
MVHHADYTNFSNPSSAETKTKRETLQQLLDAYSALETPYLISNLSNCASLLWHAYHSLGINVNWAGFYTSQNYQVRHISTTNHQEKLNHESHKETSSATTSTTASSSSSSPSFATSSVELLLGPFQGKVACQSIQWGKGVCGTAASTAQTQVVPDINKFPGHIACDGETKSEIVVPIIKEGSFNSDDEGGRAVAVIDLDCLDFNGFDEVDKEFLEQLAKLLSKSF